MSRTDEVLGEIRNFPSVLADPPPQQRSCPRQSAYEGSMLVDQGLLVEGSHDEGGDPRGVENQGTRGGPTHDRGGGLVLSAGESSCYPDC